MSRTGKHVVSFAFVHQEADLYRSNHDGSHVIQLTNTQERTAPRLGGRPSVATSEAVTQGA
jgi:hypothetical protein